MLYFFDTEFWERPGRIDLISIGIVAEDGKSYYAENAAFNWNECPMEWLHHNVKPHLKNGSAVRSPLQIKNDLLKFVGDDKPEFWGWFADYDWVVFCMIFGSMIDLPKGWPMFCRDLAQRMIDVGVPRHALPQQITTQHNAFNDAVWTKKAWEFVEKARLNG